MKLLLVDDEKHTRDGILNIIHWEQLGINEVFSAEDGIQGLETAKSALPDIILTDVRMPRMDGIAMSENIREFLPSCCIIFMSGYAEKEYLKSAIRLSAINYIEKPFSPGELESTLSLAIEKCRLQKKQSHSLSLGVPALKNQITLELLRPVHPHALQGLSDSIRLVYPNFSEYGRWTTFLISLFRDSVPILENIKSLLENKLSLLPDLQYFIGQKNDSILVVHIGVPASSAGDSDAEPNTIASALHDILKSSCHFLLSVGQTVSNCYQLYHSYQTASICLQRSFFHRSDTMLFYNDHCDTTAYPLTNQQISSFEKSLKAYDKSAAVCWLKNICEEISQHDCTLVSSVKDFFIQAALCLYNSDLLRKHRAFPYTDTPEMIRDTIWNMTFLAEIEAYLNEKLDQFFDIQEEQYHLNPVAYQIRQYVEEHYAEEELSLTVLSEHFNISESYLCVLYKKTFDITINQYIINLRMEKAREYLSGSNRKVKDIAALVGYRDCNYFIRMFKKTYHITPSDFR